MIGVKKIYNHSKRYLVAATERLTIARVNADAMERMVVEMQAEQADTRIAEELLAQSRDHLARCEAAVANAENRTL